MKIYYAAKVKIISNGKDPFHFNI